MTLSKKFTLVLVWWLASIIIIFISLITLYSLWRIKNKPMKIYLQATSNIPLINPDIVSAISLTLMFSTFFGTLAFNETGFIRALLSHIIVILPFAISVMYPKSSKFEASQLEASYDLGYGPIRSWFNTYFMHMLSTSIMAFAISFALSLDDFILTRVSSKVETIGVKLYSSQIKNWILLAGGILMIFVLSITLPLSFKNSRKKIKMQKPKITKIMSKQKKIKIRK